MKSMYCQLSKTSMPPLYNSKSMSSRGWLCLGFRICSYPTLDSDLRHRVLGNSQYGAGAVAFQIAQVGNDLEAMMFLGRVDKDPGIGHLVDCTSNYENESSKMAQSHPPVDLAPELWLVKLLLGAIDHSYDSKDEKTW
ncbi:hypothetical protein K4F52_003157 [Lecanicillium sp. MT-2017a]|nr:hypothetical protein K4F52_003157 [Lecanicillium sp. MT-2017a]